MQQSCPLVTPYTKNSAKIPTTVIMPFRQYTSKKDLKAIGPIG